MLTNNFRVKMSDRRKSHLVHSLSMFQTKPVESKGNSYQPPLFTTSSCNSILDESRRSNGYARQNTTTRRSQSGEDSNKTMYLRTVVQNLSLPSSVPAPASTGLRWSIFSHNPAYSLSKMHIASAKKCI